MSDVKDVFNLTNLVKQPTCFKSQDGTLTNLMLTNRPRSFLKSQNFEIGVSDCHKLVVSILRASFEKLTRKIITYRDQKRLNHDHSLQDLDSRLLEGEHYRNCDEPHKKLTEIFNDIHNHNDIIIIIITKNKCNSLTKKAKRDFFKKATKDGIMTNKKFWLTVKPFLTNNGCISNDFRKRGV